MKDFYVYIMASNPNGTIYVGSTNNLIRRAWEHKNGLVPGFTATYKINLLVYYEKYECYLDAARREKRMKNWPRQWKINLIEKENPDWLDLYEYLAP